MANILFLVHRLPYPPNKGDKVRSFHLLQHLARIHRVFLATFVDDPDDLRHVERVRAYCADLHVARLDPARARLRSLRGLISGEPLTIPYYRDASLRRWIDQIRAEHRIDATVVFSSAMAQYADRSAKVPLLVDFVDVDSAKWAQYARGHRGPKAWIYRREGKRLLDFERRVAALAARAFFVTEHEAALFTRLAPECAGRVEVIGNGVDARYFSPDPRRPDPFPAGEIPVVFTGAMDYLPNQDAAAWFAREVLPALCRARPRLRFYIVGRSPSPAVQALAGGAVTVTGTVPDVRPYLQYATVVVAPLRIARGIQNKILEAMAMARPVVASSACAGGVGAAAGRELLVAADAADFGVQVAALLDDADRAARIGQAARQCVLDRYSWDAHLARIDAWLVPVAAGGANRTVEVAA